MIKTMLLAAALAAAPFAATAANAQVHHDSTTVQSHDRTTTDQYHRDRTDMNDRNRDNSDMRDRDRDMRDRDRDRDRHHGWQRGHHYGWRHCMMRWHHHHRVRVCR
jgi:Ni/Co efflux regulator RcnB